MPSLSGLKNYAMRINSGVATTMPAPGELGDSVDIQGLIDRIATEEGIDANLLRAVVKTESNFNPNAMPPINPATGKRLSTAKGLTQLLDGTAKELGVTDPFNPEQNLRGGARYLKQHLTTTNGNVDHALAMYNQGPGAAANGIPQAALPYIDSVRKNLGGVEPTFSTTEAPKSRGLTREGLRRFLDNQPDPPAKFSMVETIGKLAPTFGDGMVEGAQQLASNANETFGKAFVDVASTPTAPLGKLPFGIENKGGRLGQTVKDVAYGIPEGAMTLVAGIPGFIGGQIVGAGQIDPRNLTESLASAFDVSEKIATASMGHPHTATGQLLMKPIEVVFGTLLGGVANTVKEMSGPDVPPEELENRAKAAQYITNTLLLGLPMAGKKFGERMTLRPEDVARSQSPEVMAEVKAQVKADPNVAPEVKAQVDNINVNLLEGIAKKAEAARAKIVVEKKGTFTAKFPENEAIVQGLQIEAEMRGGRAKATMNRAAKIVADFEGDIATADLKSIKGINPTGSTGKAITKLIAERDALKKSEEKIAQGVGEDAPLDLPKAPEIPPEGSVITESKPANQSGRKVTETTVDTASGILAVRIFRDPDGTITISDSKNTTTIKPDAVINQSALFENGKKISDLTDAELVAYQYEPILSDSVFNKYKKGEEVKPTEPITEAPDAGKAPRLSEEQKVELESQPDPVINPIEAAESKLENTYAKDLEGKLEKAEPLPIPEFDTTVKAANEGYTFPNNSRYAKLEKAQAKAAELGEGYEVIKIKTKYKVAKFNELPDVMEFANEAALNKAGWELMSEIPKDKLAFEPKPENFGSVKFGLAKVGDKYYRTSERLDMPVPESRMGEAVEALKKDLDEFFEDGVTPEEWAELKSRVDEATQKEITAKNDLMEIIEADKKAPPEVKTLTTAEKVKMFQEWRESYVTKCNEANRVKLEEPSTPVDPQVNLESARKRFGQIKVDDSLPSLVTMAKEGLIDPEQVWPLKDALDAAMSNSKRVSSKVKGEIFDRIVRGETPKPKTMVKKKSEPEITKGSMALIDDRFREFATEAEALKHSKDRGLGEGVYQDPLSGKWLLEPDLEGFKKLDELDSGFESLETLESSHSHLADDSGWTGGLSDTGVRDLWSIFNNERGSVDLTPLRNSVDVIESLVKEAKKAGQAIDKYLESIGVDEAGIEIFKGALGNLSAMKQQLRDSDPTGESIFRPDGEIVAQTVKRTKTGKVTSVLPPITAELATKVMNADRNMAWGTDKIFKDPVTGKVKVEHTTNAFEKFMSSTETKINTFRAAGLSELYYKWREAKSAAQREKVELKGWLQSLKEQIPAERRKDFAIAAFADMKSVREAYNRMGITEIPTMSAVEARVFEQLLEFTRKMRERSNYVRTHTGQKAIPVLLDTLGRENYLPLMRDMNVLRDMGVVESMVLSDSATLGKLSKTFNGMFNPHSKKRNVSDIPIELDPFKTLERYIDYSIDEIHISPISALAKELANVKLPRVDGVKGKISLRDWNPALSNALSNWSDYIVGKDIVNTALGNINTFFSNQLNKRSKNLVVAIIGGSIRTVLVQPTSFIIGVPTILNLRSAAYGVFKLMAERPFKGSNTRARRESSILSIREAEYAYSELVEYIKSRLMSGGKAYLAKKSLAPMKWVDSIVAEATWNAAAYYGEKTLKLSGKELIRYADDVVERTQGLGIKGAVSDIQSGAATKWLTLLQTFGIADFNFIARDVLGIKNPEANTSKTIIRVAKYIGATILTGQLYKMMGLDNVVPDPIGAYLDAKEENKGDLRAIGAAAGELLEKVPIIGGSAKFGSSLGGIVGEWAELVPEAGEKFAASLDWPNLTEKQREYNIKIIGRAIGYTMGIPFTNQILKSVNVASKGGNPYQIIIGAMREEKKRKGGGGIETIPRFPTPPKPSF